MQLHAVLSVIAIALISPCADAATSTTLGSSTYWSGSFSLGATDGGYSWYNAVWDLPASAAPLSNFQVGLSGAWISPQARVSPATCPCGTPASGLPCCLGQCPNSFPLYETMEGGPGFWAAELPTNKVKWIPNNANTCYRGGKNSNNNWENSENWRSGVPGPAQSCQNLGGFIKVSNRLVLPADGTSFASPSEGMLGVSYQSTRLGAVDAASLSVNIATSKGRSNAWLLILDAANFAGPVGFAWPGYWKFDNGIGLYGLADFGQDSVLTNIQTGFEWNTIPAFLDNTVSSDPLVRIPPMGYPTDSPGSRNSTFMSALTAWPRSALSDVLEAALSSSNYDEGQFLSPSKAVKASCPSIPRQAQGYLNYKDGSGKTYLLDMKSTLVTEMASDGHCSFKSIWSPSANCTSKRCFSPEIFQLISSNLTGISLPSSSASSGLAASSFSPKTATFAYTIPTSSTASPTTSCFSSPGPASSAIYCSKTQAGSYLAWQWYRFVDQPALQNQNLTAAQKSFIQARITKLHQLLASSAPINRWMKKPASLTPQLAGIDPALVLTPPSGLEAGYVPITIYEGLSPPNYQCSAPVPHPPSPPNPPSPPPSPPPPPPQPPSPPSPPPPAWILGDISQSCDTACSKIGMTCNILAISSTIGNSNAFSLIASAGGTCTSNRDWGYDSGPGVCADPGCCGGSCVGACTNGGTNSVTCSSTYGGYRRLCACSGSAPHPKPIPPSSHASPSPSPSPSLPPWGSMGYQQCYTSCIKQGYCSESVPGSFCNQVTSCPYGCLLASKASSYSQCSSWCSASNQPGCTTTAPYPGATAYQKCAYCPGCSGSNTTKNSDVCAKCYGPSNQACMAGCNIMLVG